MAGDGNMNAHESTYGSVIGMMKWGRSTEANEFESIVLYHFPCGTDLFRAIEVGRFWQIQFPKQPPQFDALVSFIPGKFYHFVQWPVGAADAGKRQLHLLFLCGEGMSYHPCSKHSGGKA